MAVTATPVFVQNPKITPAAFTNADSANTKKTIASAGSNGSKVVSINVSSTETANARVLQIWLTRSATSYLLASFSIIVNSGFDGIVPSVSMMASHIWSSLPVDSDGQTYLFLESGDTLQASTTTQVAAGKEIDVVAIFGNF